MTLVGRRAADPVRRARAGDPVRDRRRSRAAIAGLALVAVLAFVVRLRLLTHGAGLVASDDYDDGVYYAAADALIHGRLPYRDFLLLHPPGVLVALAPFAAIGGLLGDPVGVAAGRLAFITMGAVSAALVAWIAGRRSVGAGAVAGVTAAVFFPLAFAERSTLLEPLGNLLLLCSVVVVRRGTTRSLIVAGVLAGLAVDVKIWYVAPALVLALFVTDRRAFLAGAAAGAGVLALPFFAADPIAMVREVLVDQLGRHRFGSLPSRLFQIAGDPLHDTAVLRSLHLGTVIAIDVLALLTLTALLAWRTRWARQHVVLLATTVAVLLAGPSFFPHYVGLTGPWTAIVLGVGTAELGDRLFGGRMRIVAAVAVAVALVAVNVPADLRYRTAPQPVAALTAALAPLHGCVVSDDPGLLADADRLSRDLAHGCPLRPDVTGWTYDRDRSSSDVVRTANARWQRDVSAHLTSGDEVVLARGSTGLSAETLDRLHRLPLVARAGSLAVRATR